MLRVICLALAISIAACKTVSPRNTSTVKAWEMDGNREAGFDFIIETIASQFPEIKASDQGVQDFARALQDQRTSQTESADYILELYWQESQNGPIGPQSPIVLYIAQEFITQTNYLSVLEQKEPSLRYVGLSKP
jgi:hypothetical protein